MASEVGDLGRRTSGFVGRGDEVFGLARSETRSPKTQRTWTRWFGGTWFWRMPDSCTLCLDFTRQSSLLLGSSFLSCLARCFG